MRKLLPLIAALGLLAPPAAPAALLPATPGVTTVFVAYGTGVSRCDVTLKKRTGQDLLSGAYGTAFSGRTDCNVAVEQTARATVAADGAVPALDGGLCSAVTTVCSSGGNLSGRLNHQPLRYRITLRAPSGQGWMGDPTFCAGVGTDNLTCTFEINDTPADDSRLYVPLAPKDPAIPDALEPCTCPPR